MSPQYIAAYTEFSADEASLNQYLNQSIAKRFHIPSTVLQIPGWECVAVYANVESHVNPPQATDNITPLFHQTFIWQYD